MRRAVFLAILILLWIPQPQAQTAGFKIIVHASNANPPMDASRIAKMFLKKIKRWEDGTPVVPVDHVPDSAVREAFTEAVHEKKVSAIESYWQRQIFSGRGQPPPKLDSDQAVIELVRTNRGAIGYVAQGSDLGSGVKELKVLEQ